MREIYKDIYTSADGTLYEITIAPKGCHTPLDAHNDIVALTDAVFNVCYDSRVKRKKNLRNLRASHSAKLSRLDHLIDLLVDTSISGDKNNQEERHSLVSEVNATSESIEACEKLIKAEDDILRDVDHMLDKFRKQSNHSGGAK